MPTQLIVTADGSHSLLNTALNETYHSVHGAIQESMHVFIRNGLDFLVAKNQMSSVHILEIGFGTGLNALLSAQAGRNLRVQINYFCVEAYPIDQATAQQLNYPAMLQEGETERLFHKLHASHWSEPTEIQEGFMLTKQGGKIEEVDLERERYDVVYFDAFSPGKQPGLWAMDVLRKLEGSMKPGAVLVTYCARGQFKRDLKSLGLLVETLPGPPGKKEMVRAVKLQRS